MARIEYVHYKPWRGELTDGRVVWVRDKVIPSIPLLPQVFWQSGEGWAEANHWALEKITSDGVTQDTAKGLMKHLRAYASFLEDHKLDWRHFPLRLADRAVVRFRGDLIRQIERGSLSSATARSRINAVVQFYRHAAQYDFVTPESPMWRDRVVVIRFYDAVGFKRSLTRLSTDLAIKSRTVQGVRLEDGLYPISSRHMTELLEFTRSEETTELHLMLTSGFFTGARLGTITTLRIRNLEQALPDPFLKGFYLIAVGPGTGVATKFNIKGSLLVPEVLLHALKQYAFSPERLNREAKASGEDKDIVFLTVYGKRYTNNSVSRLMTGLRRSAVRANLRFMERFKFHQSRATYGTWLMQIVLGVTSAGAAVEFVKNAMLHKHESTTFRYIRFLEDNKGKQAAAQAFHEAFTGLKKRNWDDFNA